jgi:hypothetical protein
MKMKTTKFFMVAAIALIGWGATGNSQVNTSASDIAIVNSSGHSKIVAIDSNNSLSASSTPWLIFANATNVMFKIPSTGIIPQAYLPMYAFNYTTNTTVNSNILWAAGFGTDTGATNVNISYTLAGNKYISTNSSIIYSNATVGVWAISNSFGNLLYTNTSAGSPTNGTWTVGIGAASAGTVTYGTNLVITANPYLVGNASGITNTPVIYTTNTIYSISAADFAKLNGLTNVTIITNTVITTRTQ